MCQGLHSQAQAGFRRPRGAPRWLSPQQEHSGIKKALVRESRPVKLAENELNWITVNDELAAKLESELSMEKDIRDSESMPSHLKEYLDNSAFKVTDIESLRVAQY